MPHRLTADTCEGARETCSQLALRCPEGTFELFLRTKGGHEEWHQKGPLKALEQHFVKFCGDFPGGAVEFDPSSPYGVVGVITCDCSEVPGGCTHKCKSADEHPRALLRLCHDGTREILVGGDRKGGL